VNSLVVGLDGDDTLWHNERIFSMTEARFRLLMEPWAEDHAFLDDRLLATERRNLSLFGDGEKSFVLSMIETAIEVSGGRVPADVIGGLIEAGKEMLTHPVELMDGVAETLPVLAEAWTLILVTKGDLFDQESKLARSGLLPYLSRVEIVSEKEPATYARILDAAGITPEQFVMVGDSMRSDIVPVLALGARAVHIPGFREWAIERAEVAAEAEHRRWKIDSIRGLPALLRSID
jgi:putative hydrolase of the HAD superfamily